MGQPSGSLASLVRRLVGSVLCHVTHQTFRLLDLKMDSPEEAHLDSIPCRNCPIGSLPEFRDLRLGKVSLVVKKQSRLFLANPLGKSEGISHF